MQNEHDMKLQDLYPLTDELFMQSWLKLISQSSPGVHYLARYSIPHFLPERTLVSMSVHRCCVRQINLRHNWKGSIFKTSLLIVPMKMNISLSRINTQSVDRRCVQFCLSKIQNLYLLFSRYTCWGNKRASILSSLLCSPHTVFKWVCQLKGHDMPLGWGVERRSFWGYLGTVLDSLAKELIFSSTSSPPSGLSRCI